MRYLIAFLCLLATLITSSCGWRLYNNTAIPDKIKTMIFESYDPDNPFSRMIRNQLHTNGFQLVEKSSLCRNVPTLRILTSNLTQNTSVIFYHGYNKENQIALSVHAILSFPGKSSYPINIRIYRSVFYNTQKALAHDSENQIIINEIYNQAAIEMRRRLFRISFLK